VTSNYINSTVTGLGSLGYISTTQLQSTVSGIGSLITSATTGINSAGNIGINSASNTSNALLVTGTQSNTGNLFIGGTAFLTNSSNTGTLGVAGLTTLANTSNTGTLGVAGLTTLANSSNTGTLGVAGLTVLSSNLGIFTGTTAAQLDIRGGASSDGTLGSNMIAFQYSGGGFRHFITTRHNAFVNSPLNAIDFWLNNTVAGSTTTSGCTNTMSVTATGVGINCNAPSFGLDVNTTLRVVGATSLTSSSNTGTLGVGGNVIVTGSVTNAAFAFGQTAGVNGSFGNILIGSNASGNGVIQTNGSANTLLIGGTTAGGTVQIWANNLRVDCNVGFGVDPGAFRLNVNGTTNLGGQTTLTNSSNTGTMGVAGTATFSSNVSTRSFTNGRFDIYPTTTNNYTIMSLSGGNNLGYLYGDFQLLGDGIHMGYNYYASNGVAYGGFGAGSSRLSMGYGFISLNVGFTSNLTSMVYVSGSRVSIAPISTDFGLFAPTPTFVSSIAFNSSYNDLLNGSPSYGIGRATSGLTGLGPYTVAASQFPLQIANYHGINFVGGQSGWGAGASHMSIVDAKVGIGNPAPSYTLDVNGPAQSAIYYSSITVGGTLTVTPNNFGIFYNITANGTYTLAFSATQASSNIGKYVCFRNNSGATLSFTLTGVSGITSPVVLTNAQSATFVVATTSTYALF